MVKRDFGIDLASIKTVKAIVGWKNQEQPTLGWILESDEKLAWSPWLEKLGPAVQADGVKTYFDQNLGMYIIQPHSKVILLATSALFVLQMSKSKEVKNSFAGTLMEDEHDSHVHLVFSIEKIKDSIDQLVFQAPIPPPFGAVNKLHERIQTLEIDLTVKGSGLAAKLQATAYSKSDAKSLEKSLRQLLKTATAVAISSIAIEIGNSNDPVDIATLKYVNRMAELLNKQINLQADGDVVTLELQSEVATTGVVLALLLPAVQAAREAARRTLAATNMRELGLAFHLYHETFRRFPPAAITDKQGKPLLSWRVAILPYIEHQELYEKFHLNEPWDSEHNIKLLNEMPAVLKNPNRNETQKTNFLAVTGKGTAFEGTQGKRLRDFVDGSNVAIMIVEADKFVPWTKPDDHQVNWEDPLEGLGGIRPGVFQALMADGSVSPISVAIDAERLANLLRINDGG